jgi:serine/threonine protein phosphatase PrpC
MSLVIVEKASLTDVGRQRQGNEDSYLEQEPLFAVADGMGGARAGEVASKVAVDKLGASGPSDGSPEQHLAEVTREANREIYRMAQGDSDLAGMGTTLTAALVTGREVAIGHVGDSRLYRFRDGKLERLTQDHSLVEEFVRQGKLTPEEAESHPQRSIITRALGPEPDVEVETYTHAARDGDVYLICSDGLTGMVPEPRIAEILTESSSLGEAAKNLIDAANQNGGKDNITAVLFRLGEGEDGAGEEHDTLAGQDTDTSLSAAEVREAVSDAQATMVVRPAEARATRPVPRPSRRSTVDSRQSTGRRSRSAVAAAIGLLVLGALLVGLFAGSRQFYFLGTNASGVLTMYRGVPYDLPLGVHLYTKSYASSVPSRALPPRQRDHVLQHKLRSKSDASGLIRQLERAYVRR